MGAAAKDAINTAAAVRALNFMSVLALGSVVMRRSCVCATLRVKHQEMPR
jgi:hypothetical protein